MGLLLEPSFARLMVFGLKFHPPTSRILILPSLIDTVVSSRLSQVTSFIAIAQLNFIKESTSYIHNTVLGISNTTFT